MDKDKAAPDPSMDSKFSAVDHDKAAPDPSMNSMEDETFYSYDDEDDVPDCFQCCVCLDLLYKPVVLACGHVSCFWCVHKAMSGWQQSHCPFCRHPYYHFPSICQLLHSLIVKLFPVAYKRREMQVLEEEKETDCFSPQLDDYSTTTVSSEENNLGGIVDRSDRDNCHDDKTNVTRNSCHEDLKGNSNISNKMIENGRESGICKQISIDDVLCVACKQLLLRPSVLNCGHAYCEGCIPIPKDETLRCQVCQSSHAGSFPKVCLMLDSFLAEQFPEEYAHRREVLHNKRVCCQQEDPSACAMQVEKVTSKSSVWPFTNESSWWGQHGPNLHLSVGCDSCGMCPIVGKRYKCLDCKEAIGFDLCEDCYKTPSKLPGRFNQQHTPEHRFKQVPQPKKIRKFHIFHSVASIMTGQSEDDSVVSILSNDAPEEPENTDPAT